MQFAQVIHGSYIAEGKMVGFKLVLYSLDGLTFQLCFDQCHLIYIICRGSSSAQVQNEYSFYENILFITKTEPCALGH